MNPRSPGLDEVRLGKDTIRQGDRVMVVKNNYKLEVFNGDVGKVMSVDMKSKTIMVKIFGPVPLMVPIEFKVALRLLRLAYACTVHKAQGLEYDLIVIPVVKGFYHQLQRNLYYTAITRAKQRVILVGSQEALAKAVFNSKVDARNTLFVERLVVGGAQPTP